jgi:HPt (histidine-containing phosphotransfer) domain-containing protein
VTDTGSHPSPVDMAVLGELVKELGGDAARNGLIETYLDDADKRITDLGAAVAVDDATAVGRAAHGLRSSSALLGALPLAALLQGTEAAVQAGGGDLHFMGAEIETEYHRVASVLRQVGAAT